MISSKRIRRPGPLPDRQLRYFKKVDVPPKQPLPTYNQFEKKLILCDRDVTPKTISNPSFLTYPDGRKPILKKMVVEYQPPASPIVPMEDIFASEDLLKYQSEETIVPPKGSIMYRLSVVMDKKPEPDEPQLRRDISLDDLTRDEDEEKLIWNDRKQTIRLRGIDDDAIHNIHEFEDLPDNKVSIILTETQTMFLLEIDSSVGDKIEDLGDQHEENISSPPDEDEGPDEIDDYRKNIFEKETQTLAPCKIDTETMTMKISTEDFNVNATNKTIYDGIKEAAEKESKDFEEEVKRQKQRLYDMLMNPNAQQQMNIILKFIRDYEEDPNIEETAKELSPDYNNFIKEVKRVRDELYPLAEGVEPVTAEEVENIDEKPFEDFEGVFPEDEVMELLELDEFSTIFPKPSRLPPEEEFKRISGSRKFLSALQIVENILIYQDQRSKIDKFMPLESETERPFMTELEFTYSLELLWEFSYEEAKGKALNCIAWHEDCAGLFAAGYGKWEYKNDLKYSGPGLLLIWSVALPKERPICWLTLNAPVVCIRFHPETIYCLAVGLSSGDIVIVDINEQMTMFAGIIKLHFDYSFGPSYALSWFRDEEGDMYIVSGGRKGALFRWNSSKGFLMSEKILTLPSVNGRIKGITQPENELPLYLKQNPSIMCIEQRQEIRNEPIALDEEPIKKGKFSSQLYLVGADNGCVHECSLDIMHCHVDLFRAHAGPVNSLSFNSFIDSVFLTCGADWTVRIWVLGVGTPIITLHHELECVQCAVWSRHYPTLIASISGKTLNIWDFGRRNYSPISTFVNPKKHRFTSVSFSVDGQNVLTGDMDGNLCVYHLDELPFIPKFPEKYLITALRKALIHQPHILTELENSGPPFKEEKE